VLFFSLSLIHYASSVSSSYKLGSETSTIYIGDSHIQQGINDSEIPHSKNLGVIAESYYFSYFKVKTLLTNNPAVKEVYLGLSYHNLSNSYDQFINGEFATFVGPNYFYLLPAREKIRMAMWNENNLISFIKITFNKGLEIILKRKKPAFIGGFDNDFSHTKAVKTSMDKRLRFQYYKNGLLNPFSELNILYLKKIITLCKDKGVNITALNTPLHEYYRHNLASIYVQKLNQVIQENQLPYIDLSKSNLSDECFIPDGDHVSVLGTKNILIELEKHINRNSNTQ